MADAMAELAEIESRPLEEHPDGYARIHAGLQRALAAIDTA
ncbi:hypothetical protein [Jatrophihabitans fulvus]